jgi:large repetitive protein
VGKKFAAALRTSGGTTPVSFAVSQGSLPAGVSLDRSSGQLTGTPTATGNSAFAITAVDATGRSVSRVFTLSVVTAPQFAAKSLAPLVVGKAYSQAIAVSAGTPPYRFSVSAGALPPGLKLDPATGAIRGAPSQAGAFNFTVKVVDAANVWASRVYTGAVTPR